MRAVRQLERAGVKMTRARTVASSVGGRIVRFKGAVLLRRDYGAYLPMTRDVFAKLMYQTYGGISKNDISEVDDLVRLYADDYSRYANLIRFGDRVWDADTLEWGDNTDCAVYAGRVLPDKQGVEPAWDYMLQLSNGDEGLAADMVQSLAPLFMSKRPAGVVWFIGSGANGKSALLDAVYRIIGDHLTSLTLAAVEDGRDVPRLNGMLGNICKESSETRVEDSERYKSIGTHESFWVHKFHSQDSIEVEGDLHTVFNANTVPIFSDKTQGARRRTLIVPFPARFTDDPDFEEHTFTPRFLGGLLLLILNATRTIRDNGYKYKFSDVTMRAKDDYDSEVNSAEGYLTFLKQSGVEGFVNYRQLRNAYVDWCDENGLVPLGVGNMKRAMKQQGQAENKTIRLEDGSYTKWYLFGFTVTEPSNLVRTDSGLLVGERADNSQQFEQQGLLSGW